VKLLGTKAVTIADSTGTVAMLEVAV